jgi:hypothetical protein
MERPVQTAVLHGEGNGVPPPPYSSRSLFLALRAHIFSDALIIGMLFMDRAYSEKVARHIKNFPT